MPERATNKTPMTKAELEELIKRKKFAKEIRCNGDDKLRNLILEIFYEGMREGYELAKFRLKFFNGFPPDAADEFLDENMGKIRELLDLCKKYEELEDQEQIDVYEPEV